ncbi:MAG: (Fe-S)-binding protein [Bacteroidales bacterium]|nr:(Fe-S)-binding protein [Bacteroidales bacterium]
MTVDLFVSCIIDQFYPMTAMNTLKLLKAAGVEVEYNPEQTCCGKFAFNSGYIEDAKALGEKFLHDFPNNRPVVGISASCVGFIKTRYKELFYNTSLHLEHKRLISNIYELTDFLVNQLHKDYFEAVFPHKAAYLDSCSSLRELGLKNEGRQLLSKVNGLELVEMKHPEICCGMGKGMFALQHEAISSSLADKKLKEAMEAGAEYLITNDISCLMHLDSYAKKQKLPIEVIHIVDVLTTGWE